VIVGTGANVISGPGAGGDAVGGLDLMLLEEAVESHFLQGEVGRQVMSPSFIFAAVFRLYLVLADSLPPFRKEPERMGHPRLE
jgi:hypothetical protein